MIDHQYFVYIVSNHNRNVFYIGVCNHLVRRIIEHKYGLGSKFTRKYQLKYLIYYEQYQYIQDAIAREKEIKSWRREKKINLIKTKNPNMKDLSKELLKDYSDTEIKEIINDLKKKYKL